MTAPLRLRLPGLAVLAAALAAWPAAAQAPAGEAPGTDGAAPPGHAEPGVVPVFWLLGQSNAEGGTGGLWLANPRNTPDHHLHDQPLVRIWWPGPSRLRPLSSPRWEGYRTGEFGPHNNASGCIVEGVFGVEASFADAARRALGEPIHLFKFTAVAPLHPDHPETFSRRPDRETLFDALVAEWVRAARALAADGLVPDVRGILWVHGEADLRPTRNYASSYATQLGRFLADLRGEILRIQPDNGSLRVVIAEMHDRHVPAALYDAAEATLRAQQIQVVRSVPDTALADVDDLSLDPSSAASVHFDGPALLRLGRRMFDAWSDTDRGR